MVLHLLNFVGVCVCFLSVSATICNCSNPEIKPERSFSLVINKPITQENCKDSIVLISNWTTNLRIYQMFVRFSLYMMYTRRSGPWKKKTWKIFFYVAGFWVDPKKIRRVCMEFSEFNRLTSQRQFAPKCSFLVSRPLGHCSFRISWQIP